MKDISSPRKYVSRIGYEGMEEIARRHKEGLLGLNKGLYLIGLGLGLGLLSLAVAVVASSRGHERDSNR